MTTSIIDYIFRELAITYLGRHDLAQVDAEDLRGDALHREAEEPDFESEEVVEQRLVPAEPPPTPKAFVTPRSDTCGRSRKTATATRTAAARPWHRRTTRRSARLAKRATRATRAASAASSRWCAAAPAASATPAGRRRGAAEIQ